MIRCDMQRIRRAMLLAAVALVVLAVSTACGGRPSGSSDTRSTEAERPSLESTPNVGTSESDESPPVPDMDPELSASMKDVYPSPIATTSEKRMARTMADILNKTVSALDMEFVPEIASVTGFDDANEMVAIRSSVDPFGGYKYSMEAAQRPTGDAVLDDAAFETLFGDVISFATDALGMPAEEFMPAVLTDRKAAFDSGATFYSLTGFNDDRIPNIAIAGSRSDHSGPKEDLRVSIPVEGTSEDEYESMADLLDFGLEKHSQRLLAFPYTSVQISTTYMPPSEPGAPVGPGIDPTITISVTSPDESTRPEGYAEGEIYVLDLQMMHTNSPEFPVDKGIERLRELISVAPTGVRDSEAQIIETYQRFITERPAYTNSHQDDYPKFDGNGFSFLPTTVQADDSKLTIYVDAQGNLLDVTAAS